MEKYNGLKKELNQGLVALECVQKKDLSPGMHL